MATNTSATSQNHNGTGSQANFAISFPFLLNSEIEVTVGGDLKTLGTHYNIVGSEVQFTSGNIPASGTANIVFNRDTNISTKRVDFEDGSVLTEADLDNNVNQVLFAQQELSNDYVKRDGSQTITGNLVFEGSVDDTNETTLAITNPTADRTITIPDVTGSVVTTGDTGTVAHTMLANDAVDGDNIADDSINSEHYVGLSIDTEHIANENVTTAKLENNAVSNSKLGDNAVDSRNYVDGSIDHEHLANDIIDGDNIQDDVINSEHYVAGSIDHEHLANDIIDGDNIQDDVINSEHYVAGSIDHEHLANDIIDGDNVQDNAINNEHIAANAVRVNEIKDGEITSAKLNPNTVITASEQASATTNDTSFLTSAAADARFFNISTGDTIKDGDTFPDNDTTIATTAAINDRIIDLIDDVGGFTIIASEQAFPNVNPQGVTGQSAVLSIKAATTNLVPSGTTVTITNGNVADNADITITGVTSTIPSGFGFLVESTSTTHTYTFHRLVPKATEVTTVAGKAVEIGRLGTADAVADMAILGTADVVADMAILATNDVVADMNTLATADIVSDMNTLAVADVISDMDTVATNVTNVNNVGNNITNVNNLTNSTGANQTFTVTVQNVSGNKYFIDGVQTPVLKLARGKTYTFNLADSSNSGHPLAFRDSSDNSYTTGVTTSGTAGSSGATVVIVVAANAPSSLKYYCTSHGNAMGNTINVIDDNVGAVAGALTNVNIVGGAITNVNNVGNSISNVNTVASNISNVSSFAATYQIASSAPSTDGAGNALSAGDLYFDTTSNELRVHNGTSFQGGVTATGNLASLGANSFTGNQTIQNTAPTLFLTDTNANSDFFIKVDGGIFGIYDDTQSNALRFRIGTSGTSTFYGNLDCEAGLDVTGNITVSGNVDGRDVAADGNKLDTIESNAKDDQTAAEIKTLLDSNGIVNSNVAANAAIDGSKIIPTFTNAGTFVNNVTVSGVSPEVVFTDTNQNPDFSIRNDQGQLQVIDTTNSVTSFAAITGGIASKKLLLQDHIEHTGDSDTKISFDTDQISLHTGNNEKIRLNNTTYIQLYDHIVPNNDSTKDIGLTGTRFRAAYVDTYYGDGSNLTGINTDLVSDTSPQLGGDLDTNDHEIFLDDNHAIKFGAGNDLVIESDGTNGLIKNHVGGGIYIRANTDVQLMTNASGGGADNAIKCVNNGAVELYYDNVKQIETLSNGVRLKNGHLHLNESDNMKAIFGASDDLQIYHDGTNSYIANATGGLRLSVAGGGNQVQINKGTVDENMAKFIADGAVELYHDNVKRLETNTTGIDIVGTGSSAAGTSYIKFKTGNGSHRANIGKLSSANGALYIQNLDNDSIYFATSGNNRLELRDAGHLIPSVNNSYDLGESSTRWRNIYTNDLNLSNEGSSNDVDGTWGSYTIQEGAEDLFLVNKRNGKKYKFNLTEVL